MATTVGGDGKVFEAKSPLSSSREMKKNLTLVLKNTEFVGKSIALAIRHPEYVKKNFAMAMSHPALAMAVREVEAKSITTIPALLPGMPIAMPVELLRAGGELAMSAAACHVGAVIYDRMLRKKGNEEEPTERDRETIALSFLQEIAEIEKEANKSLHA